MERKNNFLIISLLVVVILSLIGYIVYDKIISPKNNTEQITEKQKLTLINLDDEAVVNSLSKFEYTKLFDRNLFKSTTYDIKDITKEELILTAIINSKKLKSACSFEPREKETITMDDIKTLGMESSYPEANYSFSSGNWGINDEIGIKINSDQTMELYLPCGNEEPQKTIIYKSIKTQKDDNNVYIYQKIIFIAPKEE